MAPRSGTGRRVVVFPLPYQGHLNPMLRLAAALHARGLPITVLHTELHAPDPADHPADYRFVPVSVDVPEELVASKDVTGFVMALNANCAAPFKDRLAALLAEEKAGGGVRCVITDVMWFSAHSAARELGVVALGLMTSSASSFRAYMTYPTLPGVLLHINESTKHESQKDAPVDELPPFRVKDLQRIDMSRLDDVASLFGHIVAEAQQSSGLMLNTFDAIEGAGIDKIREDLSVPVFAVGPLNKFSPLIKTSLLTQDHSCLDWLDTQAPGSVLYVSFGSLFAMDAHEFVELAWGLADSKRPFVWVIGPSLAPGFESGELPGELQEEICGRGRIVRWAPQEEILGHPAICAFLTHNGWNSTVEAISEGVPMICRPYFGDQFGTARHVCDVWRVGVEVEVETKLDRGKIRAAIEKLTDAEEGNEARDRMKDLKEMADKCVMDGGSSHTALQNLVDFAMSL